MYDTRPTERPNQSEKSAFACLVILLGPVGALVGFARQTGAETQRSQEAGLGAGFVADGSPGL
jgi:hypothetical protein